MAIALPDIQDHEPPASPRETRAPPGLPGLRSGRFTMTGSGEAVRPRRALDGVLGGPRPPRAETEPVRGGGCGAGRVTVLLPALNEEAAVGSVIDRIPADALRSSGYDVRVWVVDGQSTDATLQIARGRGAGVFVQTGEGKGSGVRQAIGHVLDTGRSGPGDRVVVMLDADGSYPPEQIQRVVDALGAGADVVVGSRFLGRIDDGAITGLNRLGNRLLSALARLLFRVPVSDLCTGMWGFREDCLRRLGLGANGFDLEADMYASVCESGARLVEVPIDYRRRIGEAKLVPLRTGFLIALRLVVRRLNHREGPAPRRAPRVERSAEGPG